MKTPKGIREAHPERGEAPDPQKGEVGFVQCQHGHVGQTFIVDDDAAPNIPKGEYNPYCAACIMIHVIEQARLKPMRFYIATREAIEREKKAAAKTELLVPQSGIILPDGVVAPQRRGRGRKR